MENTEVYLEHIQKLLRDVKVPELKNGLSENPLFRQIHNDLKAIREISRAFSSGDLSVSITARGIIPGCLKDLQAHLRHIVWQLQMVEKGDFSQEVTFMGDFSTAFNSMLQKFRHSVAEFEENEKTLKESETRFKFLANHDPLTGIYNRRSFIELAGVELANAALMSKPCCLAMMDIDHFKDLNDTFGHLAGDEALRFAVKTLELCLRKNDFMGRYGGEEFIFFFYDADEDTGFKVVERLRKNLADTPMLFEDALIPVYASFGVVQSDMDELKSKDYVRELIEHADTAMYAAKNTGRNRVMLYKPV